MRGFHPHRERAPEGPFQDDLSIAIQDANHWIALLDLAGAVSEFLGEDRGNELYSRRKLREAYNRVAALKAG